MFSAPPFKYLLLCLFFKPQFWDLSFAVLVQSVVQSIFEKILFTQNGLKLKMK